MSSHKAHGHREGVDALQGNVCRQTIYCNCDDPVKSNFVPVVLYAVQHIALKIIVTAIIQLLITGGYYWDPDFATVDPKSIDISNEISKDVRKLNGNGRTSELRGCIELLKQADIVVTNPPFLAVQRIFKVLMDNDKGF